MDSGLKGSSVIITGGGSNIGRAIVLAFAAEGANITIGDVNLGQAETVVAEAKANGASGAQAVKTDVTNLEDVKKMFEAAQATFGGVDVLVNNVGWDVNRFFTQTDPELWHKIIQLNYIGVLNCTKTALDIMIPNKTGAIVSLSSDASRQGESQHAVYGGVKAAVNGFMKSVARENGRFGIRCNVVCPGMTPPQEGDKVGAESMWAVGEGQWDESMYPKIAAGMPLKKLGKPSDIANAVVFMASNKLAGHVTGQVLSVSGGYSKVG